MDLNEILVFTKVVDAGSFRGAARELGLPKSTVSRRVAALEERLGVRLLQRTTRKLGLTEVGAAFYRQCAAGVSVLLEAERDVTEMDATPRGLLRISIPLYFGDLFLSEYVVEFLEMYPEVEISIFASDRLVDLVEEGFDMAIRVGKLPDSSMKARSFGNSVERLFASPAYIAEHGEPATPAELEKHQCIVFGSSVGAATWTFPGTRRPKHVTPRGRYTVNSFPMALDAAVAGLGIVRAPTFLAVTPVRQGKLRPVLEDFPLQATPLSIIYPSSRNLSPKVRALIDFLVDRLDPPPWELSIE
jgi:DNA-binding transcriptional LysR family regulator